jgi:hypothetical protein
MKPKYKHDCDACAFIQVLELNGEHYDIYRCSNSAMPPTWIARFGSDGPDYWSMPYDILKELTASNTQLALRMKDIATAWETTP